MILIKQQWFKEWRLKGAVRAVSRNWENVFDLRYCFPDPEFKVIQEHLIKAEQELARVLEICEEKGLKKKEF